VASLVHRSSDGAAEHVDRADRNSITIGYPVGPDAAPFIGWRSRKTDKEMVDIGAASEEFVEMAKRELGLDVRL
jgi:hypothetical protein